MASKAKELGPRRLRVIQCPTGLRMVVPGRSEPEFAAYMESCVAWCRHQSFKGPNQRLKRKWRHLARVVQRLQAPLRAVDRHEAEPEAEMPAMDAGLISLSAPQKAHRSPDLCVGFVVVYFYFFLLLLLFIYLFVYLLCTLSLSLTSRPLRLLTLIALAPLLALLVGVGLWAARLVLYFTQLTLIPLSRTRETAVFSTVSFFSPAWPRLAT